LLSSVTQLGRGSAIGPANIIQTSDWHHSIEIDKICNSQHFM
jgi:hypothetical protein